MSHSQTRRQSLAAVLTCASWLLAPAYACFAFPFRTAADDVRMAVYLWRNDANSIRGRGCALFYLVSGSNKIAMVGIGLMALALFLCIAMHKWWMLPPLPIFEAFGGFFIAGMVGYGLVALTGLIAVAYARRHRLRIWIDQDAQPDLVIYGGWPPVSDFDHNGANWIVAFPVLLAMCPAFFLADHNIVAAYVVSMTAGAVALVIVRPVIAGHPEECYTELAA